MQGAFYPRTQPAHSSITHAYSYILHGNIYLLFSAHQPCHGTSNRETKKEGLPRLRAHRNIPQQLKAERDETGGQKFSFDEAYAITSRA